MTDAADLNDLAKRYIDLWQEHLADLSADGEVADTIARTIELMSGSASAVAAFNKQLAEATNAQAKSAGRTSKKASSGATAPAPAHGGSDPDVDELARRVAELEKRLDQLESKAGKKSRKPAKKPAKSRSRAIRGGA